MVDERKEEEEREKKVSAYSPFFLATEQFIKLKESALFYLSSSFEKSSDRNSIISILRAMVVELKSIDPSQLSKVEEEIRTLENLNNSILVTSSHPYGKAYAYNLIQQFKEKANKVYEDIVILQTKKGLGYPTKKVGEGWAFSELFAKTSTPYYIQLPAPNPNQPPLLVSPEMIVFASYLIERAKAKFDNVILTIGKPGSGKTTFDFALAYTMSLLYKTYGIDAPPFIPEQNTITIQTKQEAYEKIVKSPKYSIFVFSEAGNQASNREWMEKAQNALINVIERARAQYYTLFFEWVSERYLDVQLREARAHFKVYVHRLKGGTEGIAVVHLIPEVKGEEEKPPEDLTLEEKVEWLMSSKNYVLHLPFYATPSWLNPDIGKNLGKRVIKKKVVKQKTRPDQVNITTSEQPKTDISLF